MYFALFKLVHMIVVQFSMSFVCDPPLFSSLFIISHPLAFVKRFFKLFSSFFADPFGFAFPLVGSLCIISQPLPFVKGFFKLFQVFLLVVCFSSVSRTACVLYHTSAALSIPFFEVFYLCSSITTHYLLHPLRSNIFHNPTLHNTVYNNSFPLPDLLHLQTQLLPDHLIPQFILPDITNPHLHK